MSGNPEGCVGIRGVMEAYNMALQQVTLSGPTLFSQVIGQACAVAASAGTNQMNQKYFVLLIITDGEVVVCVCNAASGIDRIGYVVTVSVQVSSMTWMRR
jgi:hypothetical protein